MYVHWIWTINPAVEPTAYPGRKLPAIIIWYLPTKRSFPLPCYRISGKSGMLIVPTWKLWLEIYLSLINKFWSPWVFPILKVHRLIQQWGTIWMPNNGLFYEAVSRDLLFFPNHLYQYYQVWFFIACRLKVGEKGYHYCGQLISGIFQHFQLVGCIYVTMGP